MPGSGTGEGAAAELPPTAAAGTSKPPRTTPSAAGEPKSVTAPAPTVKPDPLGMPLGFSTISVPAFTAVPYV